MFFLEVAAGEITTGGLVSALIAVGVGIGIILVIMLVRRFMGGSSGEAPVKDNTPEPAVEESESANDDGALIAVLTAAIIAYNKANEKASSDFAEIKGLRIVSFKERNRII